MVNILISTFILAVSIQPNQTANSWDEQLWQQLEEEKVAMNFYDAMYEKWGLLAFRNISRHEEKHMECIQLLIEEHGDPALVNLKGKGEFAHKELDALFKDMMKKGNQSENKALTAAANFEERNISSVKKLMKATDDEDVLYALKNLYEDAKCHLNLMVCHLKNRNVEYRPVVLSVSEYLDCTSLVSGKLLDQADCGYNEYNCPFKKSQ